MIEQIAAYPGNSVSRRFRIVAGVPACLALVLLSGCMSVKPRQPIHDAARWGSVQEVQAQLAQGADINARDIIDQTPLHMAVGMGNVEVARFLVNKGAGINARDRLGMTPLCFAFHIYAAHALNKSIFSEEEPLTPPGPGLPPRDPRAQDMAQVVGILLAAGTDVNIPDKNGKTPLNYAVRAGWVEGVKMLLAKDPSIKGVSLHAALALNIAPLTERVWATDPPLNTFDTVYRTPLDYAASSGNEAMVTLLLSKGAKPNLGSPLAAAAAGGHLRIVRALLDKGADVNGKSKGPSWTAASPLAAAAERGRLEVVRLLLDRGADVNTTVRRSLFISIPSGAILLVPASVSPAGTTIEYTMTPLGLATASGHRETADLLRRRGGKDSHRPTEREIFFLPR